MKEKLDNLIKIRNREGYILKVILGVCLFLFLQGTMVTRSYAQTTKVNLNVQNVELESVFMMIQQQVGYKVFYNNELVDAKQKVSIRVTDVSLDSALHTLLTPLDMTYKLVNKTIVVSNLKPVTAKTQPELLEITGFVKDKKGMPIPGVTVIYKSTPTLGRATDEKGFYRILVPSLDGELVFSFIGLENMEVPVKGRKQIDVTMKAASVLLDEVVAIGYATVKRKDLTGSVASVRSDDLLKVPSSDVTQALAGRMAGVQIIQTDGQPGATMSVRVRGGISITQSNEPLYIIDGFPTEDGMASLDPADIESIDVLKDASATAIYGARGANGVVVITTKSGAKSEGKATLTFDSYVGVRTLAKRLDVLSVEEFVLADYERTLGDATDPEESMRSWQNRYGGFVDLHENYGNRKGIDWLDRTMGRTTVTQNYRVGVNGGNDKLNYNMSYGYFKDEGAMVYSGSDKHNIALSVKSEVNKRLSVTGRINFDYLKVYGAGVAGNGTNEGGSNVDAKFNKMVQILQYRPTIGIRGSDSDLLAGEDPVLSDADGNVMQNPLIAAAEEKAGILEKRITDAFSGNVVMEDKKNVKFCKKSSGEIIIL